MKLPTSNHNCVVVIMNNNLSRHSDFPVGSTMKMWHVSAKTVLFGTTRGHLILCTQWRAKHFCCNLEMSWAEGASRCCQSCSHNSTQQVWSRPASNLCHGALFCASFAHQSWILNSVLSELLCYHDFIFPQYQCLHYVTLTVNHQTPTK